MKINKKIIEELTGYLKEFNLSEIEYAEGSTKVKVARSLSGSTVVASEVKKKQTIMMLLLTNCSIVYGVFECFANFQIA